MRGVRSNDPFLGGLRTITIEEKDLAVRQLTHAMHVFEDKTAYIELINESINGSFIARQVLGCTHRGRGRSRRRTMYRFPTMKQMAIRKKRNVTSCKPSGTRESNC